MNIDGGESGGPPFPTPVRFDAVAAEAVLDAIKPATAALKASADADQRGSNRALDGWNGAWADQFKGGSRPWSQGEATRILGDLQTLQGQIAGAIVRAGRLQRQHSLANQRWADAQHHQKPS